MWELCALIVIVVLIAVLVSEMYQFLDDLAVKSISVTPDLGFGGTLQSLSELPMSNYNVSFQFAYVSHSLELGEFCSKITSLINQKFLHVRDLFVFREKQNSSKFGEFAFSTLPWSHFVVLIPLTQKPTRVKIGDVTKDFTNKICILQQHRRASLRIQGGSMLLATAQALKTWEF